jgi:F-type H+-transporting ATPase subunit epsilon
MSDSHAHAKTFQFELISPDAVVASQPAWQVTCPGIEGVFGVRAGHMPLLAGLKPGVLMIQDNDHSAPETLFIAGGFADVTATKMTVLAEEAIKLSDLDAHRLEAMAHGLREDIARAADHHERAHLELSLSLVEAKLTALR